MNHEGKQSHAPPPPPPNKQKKNIAVPPPPPPPPHPPVYKLSILIIIHSTNFGPLVYSFFFFFIQGFEVVVGGSKYFGFSEFKNKETSICDKLNPGWAHDVLGHDRRCFQGQKQGPAVKPKMKIRSDSSLKFEGS